MSISVCSQGSVRTLDTAAYDDEQLAATSGARLLITASTSEQVEIVARRIHQSSARTNRPFVQEHARALPPASEALRGACSDLLDAAPGGSMLLSDVHEMPRAVQRLLIELIEELERERDPAAAVRLVSGSTVPLLQCVLAGTFSARLFYRLNVIHVVAK